MYLKFCARHKRHIRVRRHGVACQSRSTDVVWAEERVNIDTRVEQAATYRHCSLSQGYQNSSCHTNLKRYGVGFSLNWSRVDNSSSCFISNNALLILSEAYSIWVVGVNTLDFIHSRRYLSSIAISCMMILITLSDACVSTVRLGRAYEPYLLFTHRANQYMYQRTTNIVTKTDVVILSKIFNTWCHCIHTIFTMNSPLWNRNQTFLRTARCRIITCNTVAFYR